MIRRLLGLNALLIIVLASCLFIYPPIRAAFDIHDPALRKPGTPGIAWRLFKRLTPDYSKWATERVARGKAEQLSTNNISGTEWPLFGSVFYLWSVENLQSCWDAGDHSPGIEPKVFAKGAIIAASELVIDPKHASWVKKHWPGDYLHQQNVFYRMLVMAALTTRAKLLHDDAHLDLLRDQVETFSRELDASKSGLLDDYPGECYPGDVMAALMSIRRADVVLGTDHSKFLERALRGFTGRHATRLGLPPYFANSANGLPISQARGCANSYMCLTSPELWPAQSKQWYELYDRLFWQHRITTFGYREFARGVANRDWMMDADAGPVVAGYGVAANAFGVGAARKNGRFDRAYPLAAEMIATVGELPNGVLAMPRLLSDVSDAPMLGEAAILWQLSIQPEGGFPVKTAGKVPAYVYVVLATVFLFGLWRILAALYSFHEALRGPEPEVRAPRVQTAAWIVLMIGSGVAFWMGFPFAALAGLVVALMLPVVKRKKRPRGTEGWPEDSDQSSFAQPQTSGNT
jgi:hypothetical protein